MRLAILALLLAVPAFADSIPFSRIQETFERKVRKSEQMNKLCESLQSCGGVRDAAMEAAIMKGKYVDAGGKDTSLLKRADATITAAGRLAK